VKVVPGSSRSALLGRFGAGWRVAVTAPPEGGKANRAVEELLAAALGVDRGSVAVVAGHGAPRKTIEVAGLAADEVERRLAAATPAP
jgi:uncharacterized protein YggU (UPF0235/DUF167 family)